MKKATGTRHSALGKDRPPQSGPSQVPAVEAKRRKSNTRARRRSVVNLAVRQAHHLAAKAAPRTEGEVHLAVQLAKGEFTVDRKGNGALRNVSIISRGPAIGHDFVVDDVMLQQVADAINAAGGSAPGVKSRLSHPWLDDAIFYRLGRATGPATIQDGKVRADIVFGPYAAKSPKGGNLAEYVMGLAEEDPADIGVSISFQAAEYEERLDPESGMPLAPAGRVKKLLAVDVVDDPGANPDGLLGTGPSGNQRTNEGDGTPPDPSNSTTGERTMKINKAQRAYLASRGLGTDATDAQIKTAVTAMNAGERAYFDSLTDPTPKVEAGKGEEGEGGERPPVKLAAQQPDPADADKAAEKALSADRDRRKGILALAAGDKAPVSLDVARQWADDGVTLADAKRLAEMAKTLTPVAVGRVDGGEDRNLSTLATAACDALLLRAGHGSGQPNSMPLMTFDPVTGLAERDAEGRIVARKPHERAATMRKMPVAELARMYLSAVGVQGANLTNMSREDCINLACCRPGHFARQLREAGGKVELAMSTSDFPYILADALGKVFLGGYNIAPSTWAMWCGRRTAPDFKDVKLLNLSTAPGLTIRAEGGPITFGTLFESREVVALSEYTSGLVWTRRAQINDDMGVLQDGGARGLGAMARYKEDDVVYAILTANAAMADTGLLFNVTAVTTTGGHANLSAGSSTAVYAACAPGVHPTVVALFLESEQAPVLKQEVQWDTDDLKVAVRHTVAAKAADWRGMYKDVTGTYTVSSLAAIVDAMVAQKSLGGAFMNLRPAYILAPAGLLEVSWSQLVGSSVDPSKTNAVPNPFFNRLTVIGEPRLR